MQLRPALARRRVVLACLTAAAGDWSFNTAAAQAQQPLTALPPQAASAAATQGFIADRLARLDVFLQSATTVPGQLGAVALVARNGQLVHARAYGQRDLARTAPMPLDAIFRIYSMTKPVVSVALLTLLEEGRLTLDDPVALHLPAFANMRVMSGGSADAPKPRAPARTLTIRHLLTHTAGFATGGPGLEEATKLLERAQLQQSANLDAFAQRVAALPLGADPGTRFNYDGVNTEVLSRLIEVVSGQALDVVLRQRIFMPLGMADTGFAVPAAQRGRIAELSTMAPSGRLVAAPQRVGMVAGDMLNPYFGGGGGLYSTAADYWRFCQMLLNGGTLDGQRVLSRKTVALMTGNHLPQLDPIAGLPPGEGFGLGVSVVVDPSRRGRLGSAGAFGWSGAASTYFSIDPQEKLIAILLMQHLPNDGMPGDLPKRSVKFFNLVYQALE